MNIARMKLRALLGALLAALLVTPMTAMADSGFYLGGSYGNASVDAGVPGFPGSFDEDDNAYKIFLGFRFDLPSTFLSIEGGYADLGQPEVESPLGNATLDTTAVELWGLGGFEAGPMEFFAKVGYVSFDVESDFLGVQETDDGNELGWGLGIGFDVGPLQIRGEYERFEAELSGIDVDTDMVSVGFSYLFD